MLVGDSPLVLDTFDSLDKVFAEFEDDSFKKLFPREKFKRISNSLVQLIQATPSPCFLLGAVIDYIDKINQSLFLEERYHFVHFEFWLNHYAEISSDENTMIRAKIVGKYLPREDYQVFFPIGMGKKFFGTHYVTAHSSPDVDTTIASFWGWIDAFGARVSNGLHLWSLPGGPPESPVTTLFKEVFHPAIFNIASRQAGTLTLNAMDLLSQKNIKKEYGSVSITSLNHGMDHQAVLLIDDNGHYLGDWRHVDVELVRQVTILFNACLRWFETNIHIQLISLFARVHLDAGEISNLASLLFESKLEVAEPIEEFSDQQRKSLEDFFIKILKIDQGLQGTFEDLSRALNRFSLNGMEQFRESLISLGQSEIFSSSGELIENRPEIFLKIQKIIQQLDDTTLDIRNYMERLDIAIQIKHEVVGKKPHYLTLRNNVEEIRLKMEHYDYLTVVSPEEPHRLYPLGVIWASDLRQTYLGTVSFRDFCNPEEVKMASYLSVISVIDHHKTELQTNSPPMAIVADAQSCNVLIAEQALDLNDRYTLNGMSQEAILSQIRETYTGSSSIHGREVERLKRLLLRQSASESAGPYFIHPKREFAEYLFFLHAILDDTDLLTKVSNRDVFCVLHLLNRLKSLSSKKEVDVLDLTTIPRDNTFAKHAAKKILQNKEMYSLYKKTYEMKEKEVSESILSFIQHRSSQLFADTKVQNGCCRIGQIKVFSSNMKELQTYREELRGGWLKQAAEIHQASSEIDLHLLMISTISSADEVYANKAPDLQHRDELWFWIPETDQAQDHLAIFLSGFQTAPELKDNPLNLELEGTQAERMKLIFEHNFIFLPVQLKGRKEYSIACLSFRAGSINSRKSMISPYLPRLIP